MNIQYRGILKMDPDLKASQLKHLNQFLGKDIRNNPEWEKNEYYHQIHYTIDLELTDDFEGIRWTGNAKSRMMIAQINYLITQMKKVCPEFKLSGRFEVHDDKIWYIVIGEDGFAIKAMEVSTEGEQIRCPHCNHIFRHTKGQGIV